MSDTPEADLVRPRDLALLMLASGDLLPRQRARDQASDRAGLDLKRRILEGVAARDPEPGELDGALMDLVEDLGPPTGPTRAVAREFRDEWRAACLAPEFLAQLLAQAVAEDKGERGRGRRLPS